VSGREEGFGFEEKYEAISVAMRGTKRSLYVFNYCADKPISDEYWGQA
jgi:hypothetical protein